MTIFVDEPRNHDLRHMGWCHLWSDAGDQELHEFGWKLRLPVTWLHTSLGLYGVVFKHFDLSPTKRSQAIRLGAKFMPLKVWIMQERAKKNVAPDVTE